MSIVTGRDKQAAQRDSMFAELCEKAVAVMKLLEVRMDEEFSEVKNSEPGSALIAWPYETGAPSTM